MAAAANLFQAGQQAWENLSPLSTAGTLRTKLLAFISAISSTFDPQQEGNHPMLNWIGVLSAYVANMPSTAGYWPALRPACELLYRLCFMGEQSNVQNSITNAQYTAVLNAYNAQF